MSKGSRIHPTALVSRDCEMAAGVEIGAYAVIGEEVVLGEGTRVGPHTLLYGPTCLGRNNRIIGHAAIGTIPQDLKFHGERSTLRIGDDNTIREFVTINRGTEGGGGETVIGNSNLLMTGAHVAHDCRLGNGTILANGATLAGHVEIGDEATVGAFTGIHQFCRIGTYAFIGGYSVLTRDALPYVKTVGVRGQARTYGINALGLRRKGFSEEQILSLKRAYRWLLQKGVPRPEAEEAIRREGLATFEVALLLEFIHSSQRGCIGFGQVHGDS